jgi:AcrR family transcriptional regulator
MPSLTTERQPPGGQPRRRVTELDLERTAIELFLESGYDAVTVEQIAQAAGVSRRTFFRYFASKADLLAAEARRRYEQVCEEMQRRPRFEPTFAALCESFLRASEFDPEHLALLKKGAVLLRREPALVDKARFDPEPMGDRLTALVADRLALDPTLDMTPDLLVRLVRAAARSAQQAWLVQHLEPDLVALMHEAFELLAGARVLEVVAQRERMQAEVGLR